MNHFRSWSHRAWLFHGYLIAALALMPVLPSMGVWRQGSLDTNGYYDIDYDDQNDNQQWDSEEPFNYANSDSDNLTDVQERALGTDIHNPDSDYDGLNDFDEVSALQSSGWTSNPVDWDSDDDGYSDGDEFWGCFTVNYNSYPPQNSGWTYFDWDADGTPNYQDAYPFDASNNSFSDSDGDGVYDQNDTDPYNPGLWEDYNRNGVNDSSEGGTSSDADSDGHPDSNDSHPNNGNLWSDWNGNGINDDQNSDYDSVPDDSDSHPYDGALWSDWDHNGINDDQNSDGDLAPDQNDSHPYNSSLWSDWNGNGINDDQDSDGDSVPDENDSDPSNSSLWEDWNRNGINDSSEGTPPPDSDGDGHEDSTDSHPYDWNLWCDWNYNGVNDDRNSDGDSCPDDYDSHPNDPNLWCDWNFNGINDNQDSDADGILDDYDSDPANSALWDDWNRNGLNDSYESGDWDSDGYLNPNDSDPSNYWLWDDWNRNGMNDSQEVPPPPGDSDGDGLTDDVDPYPNDALNGDHDQDGLIDDTESGLGANPGLWDTDGDGFSDGQEVNSTQTNPALVDSDGDGLTDYEEVMLYAGMGLSPNNAHSLSATVDDWEMTRPVDSDQDGIPNDVELLWGLDPSNNADAAGDLDGDGTSNLAQYQQGLGLNTNLVLHDLDRDGMSDAWETVHGLSPTNFDDAVSDADSDGVFAYEEYKTLLDPNDATTFEAPVQFKNLQSPYPTSSVVLSDWQRFYWSIQYGRSLQLPFTRSPWSLPGLGGMGTTMVIYRYLWESFSIPGLPNPSTLQALYPTFISMSAPLPAPGKWWSWDASGSMVSWYLSTSAAGGAVWFPSFFPAGTLPENFVSPAIPAHAPASAGDWDGDGMPDAWEHRYGRTIRSDDSKFDPDFDYLTNLQEFQAHSDPTIPSTDSDLLSDYWESKLGYNPRLSDTDGDGIPDHLEDYDGDGVCEADEVAFGTNPMRKDARAVMLEVHVMITPW